jgi:hypothetical protein
MPSPPISQMKITSLESELLTCKELASALGRGVCYVYDMRAMGFAMPGGKATLDEARSFLARNHAPSRVRNFRKDRNRGNA